MTPTTSSFPRGRWGILPLLFVLWLGGVPCAAAENEKEGAGDLTELSLEELSEVELIPLDVLGTHIHFKGDWMLGYKFMYMEMDGNRDGTDSLSVEEVLAGFPVSPTNMSMEMHMFEGMYGVTDDVTVMLMVPFVRLSMDHSTRMGVEFTTESEGLGDIQVMTHYVLKRRGPHWLILRGSLALPTGSIDERDATPAGPDQPLPYPMQLGTGSYDLIPGLTYTRLEETWTWAAEGRVRVSLNENDRDYRHGTRYRLNLWGKKQFTSWFAPSVRLDGQLWQNYHGADPRLNPKVVPTADPDRRGGRRVDLLLGFNFYLSRGRSKGHRLGIEGGLPIYQSLDGPQLETDSLLNFVWQWTF